MKAKSSSIGGRSIQLFGLLEVTSIIINWEIAFKLKKAKHLSKKSKKKKKKNYKGYFNPKNFFICI